ncbi:MAG: EF-hand domain-containing protein, partial [Gemmatales bacterium]|nr:EF-hand domain-containing protein [Gemmatales bacterium]
MSRVIFHLFAVFITAFQLACLVYSQEKPTITPPTVPATHHDLLVLTDERPLLLRLNVFLNGRPISEHWRERSVKLFQFLDANRDGTLSREEGSRLNMVIFPNPAGGALPVDYDRDGRITQEEFQRWLYEINSGPVAIRPYYTMA